MACEFVHQGVFLKWRWWQLSHGGTTSGRFQWREGAPSFLAFLAGRDWSKLLETTSFFNLGDLCFLLFVLFVQLLLVPSEILAT